MEKLSYQTLKDISYPGFLLPEAPERILQFGEGNFLRAFVEDFVDQMNERAGFCSKVVACQPSSANPAMSDRINRQEGLYTLRLQGLKDGQKKKETRVVSCVSRCLNLTRDFDEFLRCAANPDLRFLVSNTTEAGIAYDPSCAFSDRPASSFPGKLTQFLYRRYQEFGGIPGKGFLILSCELIEDNGRELERCVLRYAKQWGLGSGFCDWLRAENLFCSTLVDRIVTGYPRDSADEICQELGYQDELIDIGEPFASWVIEGPDWLKKELPFEEAGLPVLICQDHHPYKQRKVRILNGAHTSMVCGAYLAGMDIVRDCMEDGDIHGFLRHAVYEEILPTLTLPEEELTAFAAAVEERFRNPYLDHQLLSISLNSSSKWRARVLPSLKAYMGLSGSLPECLTASLAFWLAFCRGTELTEEGLVCQRPARRPTACADAETKEMVRSVPGSDAEATEAVLPTDGSPTSDHALCPGNQFLYKDSRPVLNLLAAHSRQCDASYVHAICSDASLWGEDLTAIPGLEGRLLEDLALLYREGARALLRRAASNRC